MFIWTLMCVCFKDSFNIKISSNILFQTKNVLANYIPTFVHGTEFFQATPEPFQCGPIKFLPPFFFFCYSSYFPGSPGTFPDRWESAISPRNSSNLEWDMLFRNKNCGPKMILRMGYYHCYVLSLGKVRIFKITYIYIFFSI